MESYASSLYAADRDPQPTGLASRTARSAGAGEAALVLPVLAVAWGVGSLAGAACAEAAACFGGVAVAALAVSLLTRWKLLFCVVAAAAVGALAVATPLAAEPPLCHVGRHTGRQVVRLWAEVVGAAERTAEGSRQRVLARALERADGVRVGLCGHVELRRGAGAFALHPGEQVLLRARLRRATSRRNPGLPSATLRYRAEDIGAVAYVDQLVITAPRAPSIIGVLRDRLRRTVDAHLPPGAGRAIVAALVLGDRDGLTAEQAERFSRSGLSHLLSVSGLHLSLVALGLFAGLRALLRRVAWLAARRDPRAIAAVGAAVAAVLYTMITGAEPATVRSCVMSLALFVAAAVGRAGDSVRPLCLAGLGLAVAEPLVIFRPAFQLSFVAVVGIMLVVRRTERGPRRRTFFGRALHAGTALVLATTGATLLTTPFVAHHFGVVSLAAVPANLVAVPLTNLLVLPLALVGTLLVAVAPLLGVWPLRAAGALAEVLDGIATLIGRSPFSAITWHASWPLALALLALAAAPLLRRSQRRRRLTLGALLLVVGISAARGLAPPRLELVFLDVGQGDATFVRFPDGSAMLVDGGGSSDARTDPGRRVVLPFLRRQGVRRLDLVVATHPHADHVAGLGAVLDGVAVGELWACWHEEPSPLLEDLLARARRRGIPVRAPRVWTRGAATVRPLWPRGAAGHCADAARSTNDNSIVLRLEHGRASALLSGDMEADVDAELVRRGVARATLLKVAHHGSATATTEDLLRAVRPRLAVISCAPENAFGLPHARVLRRLAAQRVGVARTDELGALVARLYADGGLSWEPACALLP